MSVQVKGVQTQIDSLLDRLIEATNKSVMSAYETRIETLERQKILSPDQAAKSTPPKGPLSKLSDRSSNFWQALGIFTKKAVSPCARPCSD